MSYGFVARSIRSISTFFPKPKPIAINLCYGETHKEAFIERKNWFLILGEKFKLGIRSILHTNKQTKLQTVA